MDKNLVEQRAKVFEHLFDAVVITDLQGTVTDWNKSAEALYGYTKEEAIGQNANMLHVADDRDHISAEIRSSVEKIGKWNGELQMRRQDGNIGWIESEWAAIYAQSKQMIGMLCVSRNITGHENENDDPNQSANRDRLTAIPNRYLLLDRVEHLVAQSDRNNSHFALLYLDLDKFKAVNDSKGHSFGDQVLKEVASRFAHAIRQSDTIARIGGDEFVILLENTSNKKDISSTAQSLIDTLEREIIIGDEGITLSCSIGISIYPEQGADIDALLKAADFAMYKAKHSEHGAYSF